MFFNAEEDEGDFLSPSSGSKLGALFGIDQASSQGGNESLKYSAPKQPKKKTETAPAASAPAVLNASAVQAYKYVDGQYTKQGKLGAAILGNHSNQDYKILLYVSKQQQVTNAKIYSGFSFTVQANNYASFYDDARQSWSVMFDNEAAAIAFTKQVCLAKALCSGPSLDVVVSQDLTLGEGGPLESGDSAEVKYTGWLLNNNTFGKVFDTNTNAEKLFRFKLGKGKVIRGWDIGLVGMKKNGKRLLVVPPNFAYGEQGMGDRVPSNSTLIFEIEVVRVKLSKADSPTESPAPTPPTMSEPVIVEDLDETTVKGRSRSISEQLAQSPKSDKAKLISRMAKMGQPMLPMSGAVAASPDDDEENTQYYEQQQPVQQQQQPVPQTLPAQAQMMPPNAVPVMQTPIAQPQYHPQLQPQVQPIVNHMAAQPIVQQQQPAFVQNLPSQQLQQQQMSLYQPIQPQVQQQPFQQMQPNPGPYGVQPPQPYNNNMYPASSFPGASQDMNTPLLMSEARQQNTEVRISVGKVADKVDKILEKLEHMQVHGAGGSLALPGNTPPMENGVLLHNIQKVIQENERLKKELFEKSARIESQNEKIGDLLQRNQRYVEQSNLLLEQRNDTFKNTAANSQARVLTLEQDKVQIATELSVTTAQISSLQLELATLRKKEGDIKHQLSTVLEDAGKNKDEINRLKIAYSDEERKAAELTESLKDEKLSRKQLENQVSQLKEEMADLKMTNDTLDKNLSERKKKLGDEKRKLEEELEEVKSQYEEEVQSLKNKLRKQKSSTDAATADQVAQLEKEITEEWQEKVEKMMKAAEDKHKRALKEVKEEKSQAEENVKDLEKKLQGLKASGNESEQKVTTLQSRVEDLEMWKDKYDNLRSQAAVMKERYEERITELEERLSEKSSTDTQQGDPQDVANEVKKIMSSVYHSLRGELNADKSYKGQEALTIILNTIKSETLKMVKKEGGQTKAEESEEESEEEDEEDESEEEADEEPVVVETISAQKASSSQGGVPSKETPSGKHVPKEKRTMASIEDQVLSQLMGSGGMITDNTSASPKKDKEPSKGGEDLIKPSVDKITGDKGNKYYSEELDKSKGKSDITKIVEPTVKSATGNTEIKEVIEEPIKSSKDAITGDKGNIYYSAELDKGKGAGGDKPKQDIPKDDKKAGRGDNAGFSSAEIEAMLFGSAASGTGTSGASTAHTGKPDGKGHEPIVSKSAAGVSNQPVQSEVIEPMIASSVTASNLGAKPKGSKSDKKPVSEGKLKKSSDKPTGDKGNRYHTEKLDKSGAPIVDPLFSKSTAHVTGDKGNVYHTEKLDKSKPTKEQPKAVVETMAASSAGGGLSATPGHTTGATASKPTAVEEPMMMAKSSSVSMAAQPVHPPKITKSKDHPTGDKGNVYHSAKLDQSSKPKAGGAKVEPHISKSADHPTGDKGNPHHTAHLNQSGKGAPVEAVESKIVSSSGGKVMGGNPYHSSDLGKSTGSTGGKSVPVEEPMVASSVSAQTMAASPSNAKKDKKKKAVAVEPMISKKSDHVTGDRGNKYHTAKLDQSAAGKSSKAVPVVEPLFAKSSGHVTGDKGNPYHSAKLDGKKDSPVIPPATSREPPPLDSSLFGDDNTVLDTFGTDFKPQDESKDEAKKTDTQKDDKKPGDKKLPSKTELLSDDSLKEKPPPLFGDDDDDDLDWLSK